MPIDLEALAQQNKAQDDRLLTKSPEEVEDHDRFGDQKDTRSNALNATMEGSAGKTFAQMRSGMTKRDQLHPYTNALSPKDADSCTLLEAEAFPANERCTKEKVSEISVPVRPLDGSSGVTLLHLTRQYHPPLAWRCVLASGVALCCNHVTNNLGHMHVTEAARDYIH